MGGWCVFPTDHHFVERPCMKDLVDVLRYLNIVLILDIPTICIMFGTTPIRMKAMALPNHMEWVLI